MSSGRQVDTRIRIERSAPGVTAVNSTVLITFPGIVAHAGTYDVTRATPGGVLLEPGCVVLFSGVTDLEHRIQDTLRNHWTRCAIVVPGLDGNPVLLQSTSRPIAADLITGQLLTGVQMVAICDVLARFEGEIGFRPVAPPLSSAQSIALAEFALKKLGLPFNYSPYYALRAARRRNREGDGTKYYCTELVAATLQQLGVLVGPPCGRSASNHVPGDFAASSEDLALNSGYTLRPQETVRCPRAL